MGPDLVYVSCAAASALCAALLLRGWVASRQRLLFWSALCFVGLALNNALMVVDYLVVPNVDLALLRTSIALAAVGTLLFGLVWESG
jgi:hypothetical protein